MNKKKVTKKKPNIPKRIVTIVSVIFLVLVLLLAVAVQQIRMRQLEHDSRVNNNFQLSLMIIRAVDGLRKPVVEEPKTGKQYIPDAKLVLPERTSNEQRASYSISEDENYYEVQVTNNVNVDSAKAGLLAYATADTENTMSKVPYLQACSRGVHILLTQSGDDMSGYGTSYGSKVLSNGKTAHFYMEDACKNDAFIEYVKGIDSY